MAGFSDRAGHVAYHTARRAGALLILQRAVAANIQASIYVNVASKLGKNTYRELCDDPKLVLEHVSLCQEELHFVGKSLQSTRRLLNPNYIEAEEKKRLINHDFLILKIQPGNRPPLYLRAEKLFGVDINGSKQGIHISIHEELDDIQDMERRCCLHSIGCGSRVGLGDIMVILEMNPNYDVCNDNCWDYARRTTKRLLQACMIAVGEENREHSRLKKELEQLETKIIGKHFKNTGLRMVNYAKTVGQEPLKRMLKRLADL